MNPEILRFGRINAAASTKSSTTMELDSNLSFMTLLPVKKSAVRNFRHLCFSARRYGFDSRAVDERNQATAAVPYSLFVFPGGVHIQCAAVSHFNDGLGQAFARTGFLSGGDRALIQLNGGGFGFRV